MVAWLWLFGIGALAFAIGTGLGEILNGVSEIVGGLVSGILGFILKPFPSLVKILLVIVIVAGSYYLVYTYLRWYWLIVLTLVWIMALSESDDM